MSGTGYIDERSTKTAICEKCEGLKTWNYWYHTNENLCDDCYYHTGKYCKMSKEQAVFMEKNDLFKVREFIVGENYTRRGSKARFSVMLFDNTDENVNNFGHICVDLDNENLIEKLLSFEFGEFKLDKDSLEELKVKLVYSRTFIRANRSYLAGGGKGNNHDRSHTLNAEIPDEIQELIDLGLYTLEDFHNGKLSKSN